MTRRLSQRYHFGGFELDTAEGVLRRGGRIVPLTPKALQALELLLANVGRVVSRKDLISKLWPDSFVEESNLTVAISMVRKAIGETDETKFIETVAKRGYRFVADVAVIKPSTETPATFSAMQISRLTHDGYIMDVALSTDARFMAHVLIEAGRQSLWVQDMESAERWQLLPPDPALCWGLKFTQDGEGLFYITTQPNSTISELFRTPTRKSSPQKLIVNLDATIALSPDERSIAFVRSFPGQHRDALVLADIDGNNQTEIVAREHPDKFSFAAASWSPDGKVIALGASRYNGTESAILGVFPETGEQRELSRWQWKTVCAVAWNDDASALYFSAMALNSNSFQIWRLRYPDGQADRVTNDPNNYEELSLAEKAAELVTMQTDVRANLYVSPGLASLQENQMKSAGPRRISSGRTEGFDGLTVASGRIVYALTEHQQPDLWSIDVDGSDRQRLTHSGGFLPSISGDGKNIAYVSTEGGRRHIWCMNADGSNKKQLTSGGGESFPTITSDGQWVIFTALSGERNTLWKVSVSDGKRVQLTRDSLCIKPVVSPDGTRLICAHRRDESDRWKIAVMSIDGAGPLLVLDMPNPYNQIIRWTADGQAVTFLQRHEGVHNIWRQPLSGGEPRPLTNFTEDLIYAYDWLSEENQQLIVSRGIKRRDIVLIKDFE